ncbi:MAG: MBL fold metallo-hydrolase [Tannerella sp.]|nr:MBL fold metallo-hydrolase [Tannerella sp.]
MTLTYIYHSGYLIEYQDFSVIIDFWKDSDDRHVQQLLHQSVSPIYVLASHWHPDHFSREIMKWRDNSKNIKYILSSDIIENLKRTGIFSDKHDIVFLSKGDIYSDDKLDIKAFGSTDCGISFLIETNGRKVFHAGDLNNWHWDEDPTSTPDEIRNAGQSYLREIDDLKAVAPSLDVAMFPVDKRLGTNYMLGAQQFVETIKTSVFAPMHFGSDYVSAAAFRPFAEKAGCNFIEWTKTGQSIDI